MVRCRIVYTCLSPSASVSSPAMSSPRLSDKELFAINQAAVTKEYKVDPRIGPSTHQLLNVVLIDMTTGRLSNCIRDQRVRLIIIRTCAQF